MVGVQGKAWASYYFVPFSVGPADGAKRPIAISIIATRKTKDIVRTQRGWDMSVSWLHARSCGRGELVFANSAAGVRCRAWLACKSAQRFTNALALGVPALGYASYPSIQDACQGSELCLTTFEAADAKRTVLDLAADDAKYRKYQESAARLSRTYHPSRIARRYAAMARALLAHAEDVHRSPIVDTAECRAWEDWAASGEVGERGELLLVHDYLRSRFSGSGGSRRGLPRGKIWKIWKTTFGSRNRSWNLANFTKLVRSNTDHHHQGVKSKI